MENELKELSNEDLIEMANESEAEFNKIVAKIKGIEPEELKELLQANYQMTIAVNELLRRGDGDPPKELFDKKG